MREIITFITTFEIIVSFLAALTFVVSYGRFFNWRKTDAGKAVMWVFVTLIAMSILALIVRFIGTDFGWYPLVSLAGWTLFMIALLRLVCVLWSNWSRGEASLDLERKDAQP